jgi:hypothetical protein
MEEQPVHDVLLRAHHPRPGAAGGQAHLPQEQPRHGDFNAGSLSYENSLNIPLFIKATAAEGKFLSLFCAMQQLFTANNFPFMYSQKRFCQNRIIMFCLEL